MNDDELLIKLKLDDSELKQQLKSIEAATAKAFSTNGGSGGSAGSGGGANNGPAVSLGNAANKAQDLLDRLKLLEAAQQRLAGQPGMEKNLAKVNQEIAGIVSQQKRMATDEQSYIALLEKEVNLRRESKKLTNESEGGKGFFSAHSQRQNEQLESFRMGIANGLANSARSTLHIPVVETGLRGILQKTIGGGGAAAEGAEGAAAGGVSGAAIGALGVTGGALAIKAVLDKMGELGQAAEKLSQSFGNSGGSLDQLRESSMRASDAQKRLAESPAAQGFQTVKNNIGAGVDSVVNGLLGVVLKIGDTLADINPFGDHEKDKKDRAARKNDITLGGDLKEQNDKLKLQEKEMLRDQAQAREELEHNIANRRRDLALEVSEFEVQQARKVADEKKKAGRENDDYQRERTKLTADVEFKASEKKYAIDQQAKRREFSNKQSDEKVDFKNKQSDEKRDFKNSQGDKAADFARQSGYRAQDAAQKQQEIGLKGGDALDFLLAGQDAQKEQARAAQEFAVQSARENRDFGNKQSDENRDFGLKQGREGRDFKDSTADEAAKHLIDVQTHQYQLQTQLNELDIKHMRAVEDSATALQRLAEDADFARQKFKNQGSDLDYDEKTGKRNLSQSQEKEKRGFSETYGSFAKGVRDQLSPEAFNQVEQNDPRIGQEYDKELARRGTNDQGLQDVRDGRYAKPNNDAYHNIQRDTPQDKPLKLEDQTQKPSQAAQEKAIANGSPKGIPTRDSPEVQIGKSMGLKGTGLADYLEQHGYDVSNTPMDSLSVGGFIDRDKVVQVHAGEYVVNPARKDNLSLLMAAGQKMSDNGHYDFSADTVGWHKSQQSLISQIMGGGGPGASDSGSGGAGGGSIFGMSAGRMQQLAAQAQQQNNNITNQFQFGDIHATGSGGNDMGNFIQQALMDKGRPLMQQVATEAITQYHQQRIAAGSN